jgi:glycosyltransferase involved in cell wall biosynthesis
LHAKTKHDRPPNTGQNLSSVLFLNRSYWPDGEATGQLLTELCEDLAASYRVTVITGQPNANIEAVRFRRVGWETRNGVRIRRVWNSRLPKSSFLGRAFNYITFLVAAACAAFTVPRVDILVAETDPPLLCLIAAILRRWHRSKLVIYLQDIYPDLAVALKKLPNHWLTKLLRRLMFGVYRRADRVIVLSRDMRQLLERNGIASERIRCIPNWIDCQSVYPVKVNNAFRRKHQIDEKFVVMYSGNLGLCQRLEDIVEAAALLRERTEIAFVFVGGGAKQLQLKRSAELRQLKNVRFLPYQPKSKLATSISAADLHLIPLDPVVASYLMPSKLYGVLASGTPVLAIATELCELAQIVKEEKIGVVCPPAAPRFIADAIAQCAADRKSLPEMGIRARQLAERLYDRSLMTSRFGAMLGELARTPRPQMELNASIRPIVHPQPIASTQPLELSTHA